MLCLTAEVKSFRARPWHWHQWNSYLFIYVVSFIPLWQGINVCITEGPALSLNFLSPIFSGKGNTQMSHGQIKRINLKLSTPQNKCCCYPTMPNMKNHCTAEKSQKGLHKFSLWNGNLERLRTWSYSEAYSKCHLTCWKITYCTSWQCVLCTRWN